MDIPELVLQVKYKFDNLTNAERTGDESLVRTVLCEMRDLLNRELPAEAPAEPETPAEPSEG